MNKKIRILRIVQTLDKAYGGISNYILDSSRALTKYGFEVDILTYDKPKSFFFKKICCNYSRNSKSYKKIP